MAHNYERCRSGSAAITTYEAITHLHLAKQWLIA